MTQTLVFVVGASRSGTTLMGSILGLHPSIFTLRELHFFEQIWPQRRRRSTLNRAEAIAMVSKLLSYQRMGIENRPDPRPFTDEAVKVLCAHEGPSCTPADTFEAFLQYEAALHGRSISCDHTPRNVYYAELILQLYPGAKVVQMIRDPRDVLASQKHKWRMHAGEDPPHETLRRRLNYHPISTSLRWNAALRAGEAVANQERYRAVRFESLILDPGPELHSLCDFLGLEFARSMLDVPVVNSSFENPCPDRMGVSRTAIGRWMGALCPAEVFLCQRATRDGMKRYGYSPATVPRRVWRTAGALAGFLPFAVLTLLMRSLRFRKLVSAGARHLGRAPWRLFSPASTAR